MKPSEWIKKRAMEIMETDSSSLQFARILAIEEYLDEQPSECNGFDISVEY